MVKNNVVKKTEYNKLVTKFDNIDTKDGTDFEDKINKIDKNIPDVASLFKRTDFNTKVTEIEGKIPDVSSLVTKYALKVV